MKHRTPVRSKVLALVSTIGLTVSGLVVGTIAAPAASADISRVLPPPATAVTADALPTVQIDGVAWSQAVAGNTVYAVGKFATARPAGAPAGTNTTVRNNALAYDITTGNLISTFDPNLNGQALAVAVSPDGSRVYIGGDFSTANGVNRYRIAAFSTATGQLVTSFAPIIGYRTNAIVATNSTVYVAGSFNSANGNLRNNVAAFSASNGALLGWNPNADSEVKAMTLTPDGSRLIIGGRFQNVGGTPQYGLAAVDATTGSSLPWAAGSLIRNAGTQAAITSLRTDIVSNQITGTGYVFGQGGNLEGTFAADPNTGNVKWIEDCHGDTYDNFPINGLVYTVSHAHYCSTVGGFFQSDPWATNTRHALAFTANSTGTLKNNEIGGYYNFGGNPSPSMVNWFPDFYTGKFTGQGQAAWSVTGNSKYIVMGGEFPGVNGNAQQGLVRFAVKPIAPSKQGPRLAGPNFVPNATSLTGGTVRLAFPANWDRDNKSLNYRVVRNGNTAQPVYQVTADSTFWERPSLGFVDSALTPGSTVTYRLYANDSADPNNPAAGNIAVGDPVSVTVSSSGALSNYAKLVQDQGANAYWRLGEPSGASVYDWVGFNDGVAGTGVTRGAPGMDASDTNTASTFDGTANGAMNSSTSSTSPDTFTTVAWIKTTSQSGGKIVGFGNAQSGSSSSYDRHSYMDNSGRVWFGVYSGGVRTVNSAKSYNDGNWHQVVTSLSSNGMALYVDGLKVASRTDTTSGDPYTGYWRVGGDSLGGWTSSPSSANLAGTIDEVSIYPSALTKDQIMAQWTASGRTSPVPAAPADSYGAAVYNDQPDLFWRLGETGGPLARDSGASMNDGTYNGGLTFAAPGALPNGAGATAVTFNGADGFVASNATFIPTTFSEEAWFKTTTSVGGKIIGFGDQPTGNSGSYDRHVYMQPDGHVVFGTWTGQANTITTSNSLNDDQWHHVVATQGADGMNLYVDGQLAGTNPQTQAQPYSGYWRVGGDSSWSGSNYFAGTIDEAAVYPTVLTATKVLQHFQAGGGQLPNNPPVASLTTTATNLKLDVNGSGSIDPDGTIAGYAWDFGDGATAAGATASHVYQAAGTYTVALTVTDNRGATNSATRSVTVTAAPPNNPPSALFTTTTTNLKLDVDGATSSDSDGTVTAWAWEFGDGTTASGKTASHIYGTPGTYSVKLTVTDNAGGTGSTTTAVTVAAAPPNQPPTAAFTSQANNLAVNFDAITSTDPDGTIASYTWDFGDGTSGTGQQASRTYGAAGTYTVKLTVTDDNGATGTKSAPVSVTAPPPANVPPTAAFTSTATNLAVAFDGSASKDADGSIAGYAWDFGDGATGNGSTPNHVYGSAGTYPVKLTVTDNRGGTDSVTTNVTVTAAPPANQPPIAAFTASTTNLVVSVDASGSSDPDGSVASYAWDFGDQSTGTGRTATHTYATAGTYQVTLTVTDNKGANNAVTKPVTTQAAVNNPPVAAFTSTTADLKASVDANGSTDADGTIASYVWDFGDGSSGTGKTSTRTYLAAGTYQVKLTVTDNAGASTSVTQPVTVASAPPQVFASDQFARTIAAGWGTADQGGSWTLGGGTSNFATNGGFGKITMTAATGPSASLNSVSVRDVDATVDFSLDKAASGGGTYVYLATRKVGNSSYQLSVRVPASGVATLSLLKVLNNSETVLRSQSIPGLTVAPNEVLRMRLQVTGSGTSTLTGKVWKPGATEPAWQVNATDSEASLQGAGAVGVKTYLSGTSTNAAVTASLDNLTVKAPVA